MLKHNAHDFVYLELPSSDVYYASIAYSGLSSSDSSWYILLMVSEYLRLGNEAVYLYQMPRACIRCHEYLESRFCPRLDQAGVYRCIILPSLGLGVQTPEAGHAVSSILICRRRCIKYFESRRALSTPWTRGSEPLARVRNSTLLPDCTCRRSFGCKNLRQTQERAL